MHKHPDLFSDIDMPAHKEPLSKTSDNPQTKVKNTGKQATINPIIKEQINLSSYLSPYANTTNVPSPQEATRNLVTHPQIKIVPLGTGSGKSYSSVLNYIHLQSMKLDLSGRRIEPLHRNKGRDNFTNGIFITPIKNQISISKTLVDEMWKEGITPVSLLAVGDIINADNTLWCSNTGITVERRLLDYLTVLGKIERLVKKNPQGLPTWMPSHLYLLKINVIKILSQVQGIKALNEELQKTPTKPATYNAELAMKKSLHSKAVIALLDVLMNNQYGFYNNSQEGNSSDENSLFEAQDDDEDLDSDIEQVLLNSNNLKHEPYDEDKVYDEVFEKALLKNNFDELVSDTVRGSDDVKSILATLKKDILRVYAPLDFASYLPSFICMTTDKSRTKIYLHRKSHAKGKYAGKWVLRDVYYNLAELVGNKTTYLKAISSLPSNTPDSVKAEVLRKTLLMQRQDLSGWGGYDDRTPFKKRDINFYIIVDECNELFMKDMIGNKISKGVVTDMLPETFSITDAMSCIERKFREFVECGEDTTIMHCYKSTALFFGFMHGYLRDYCDISVEKVLNRKINKHTGRHTADSVFLSQFASMSNILYINNSEADTLINIAENAFTVGAKSFIDKNKLQSIYFNTKGHHGYLSLDKGDAKVSLYEVYQVLVATIYACIKFAETSQLTLEQKNAFFLDLAYLDNHKSKARQNSPLQQLLTFAMTHHKEYIHWLETKTEIDNDEVLDDWYAYIQTKLVFSLMVNKTFDTSPDEGHKTKTFIDVGLHLVTHHPELNLLRMVEGTSNHVAIMSATSGKEVAYSCQYSISFLQKWGKLLDVKVSLPEHDNFYKKDYRKIYKSLRDKQTRNRVIKVHNFDDLKQILAVLDEKQTDKPNSKPLGRLSALINTQKNTYSTLNKLRTHLVDISKSRGADISSTMLKGSHNDKAFDVSLAFLLLAIKQPQTSLHTSPRSALVTGFSSSILREMESKFNKKLLKTALDEKQNPIFVHGLFGEFQLPLLNKHLESHRNDSYTTIRNLIRDKFYYMIDFLEMKSEFDVPDDVVVRIALYDSNIDKVYMDYRTNFEVSNLTHKGCVKILYTHILSYDKVVSVGLNNTIENKVLGVTQDVNNLFLSTLSYYSIINEKDGRDFNSDTINNLNRINNALFYMRYLSDEKYRHKRTAIKNFDSNLSGDEAIEFLKREHEYHLNNNTKQTLGRTERVGGQEGFVSNIYLTTADLMKEAKIEFDSAKMNEHEVPTLNKIDFEFMSMNNMTFYEAGVKLLKQKALDEDSRKQLENDTQKAVRNILRLTESTKGSPCVMTKILNIARSGDKNEQARKLADSAIRFDLAYRETTILSNPVQWKSKLVSILEDSPDLVQEIGIPVSNLAKFIDSAYVDVSKYGQGNFDLYQSKDGGLTDFFGDKQPRTDAYNPYAFVVKNMANTLRDSKLKLSRGYESALGLRHKSLLEFNNSLVDKDSSFYANNEAKNLILHPSMLHMALGNLGEAVFSRFLELHSGAYRILSQDEVLNIFGYQSYELFDFWIQRQDGAYVCVDVKNMSHRANKHKAKKHIDQQRSKLDKIENGGYDGLGRLESLSGPMFRSNNKVYHFYVNIRENADSNNRKRIVNQVVEGREVEYHTYNVCLFQTFRRSDSNKKYAEGKWMGFLSIDLFESLGISIKSDEVLVTSIIQSPEQIEGDSYTLLESISESIKYDYDDSQMKKFKPKGEYYE